MFFLDVERAIARLLFVHLIVQLIRLVTLGDCDRVLYDRRIRESFLKILERF